MSIFEARGYPKVRAIGICFCNSETPIKKKKEDSIFLLSITVFCSKTSYDLQEGYCRSTILRMAEEMTVNIPLPPVHSLATFR